MPKLICYRLNSISFLFKMADNLEGAIFLFLVLATVWNLILFSLSRTSVYKTEWSVFFFMTLVMTLVLVTYGKHIDSKHYNIKHFLMYRPKILAFGVMQVIFACISAFGCLVESQKARRIWACTVTLSLSLIAGLVQHRYTTYDHEEPTAKIVSKSLPKTKIVSESLPTAKTASKSPLAAPQVLTMSDPGVTLATYRLMQASLTAEHDVTLNKERAVIASQRAHLAEAQTKTAQELEAYLNVLAAEVSSLRDRQARLELEAAGYLQRKDEECSEEKQAKLEKERKLLFAERKELLAFRASYRYASNLNSVPRCFQWVAWV